MAENSEPTRRRFLGGVAAVGAGAAVTGVLGGEASAAAAKPRSGAGNQARCSADQILCGMTSEMLIDPWVAHVNYSALAWTSKLSGSVLAGFVRAPDCPLQPDGHGSHPPAPG